MEESRFVYCVYVGSVLDKWEIDPTVGKCCCKSGLWRYMGTSGRAWELAESPEDWHYQCSRTGGLVWRLAVLRPWQFRRTGEGEESREGWHILAAAKALLGILGQSVEAQPELHSMKNKTLFSRLPDSLLAPHPLHLQHCRMASHLVVEPKKKSPKALKAVQIFRVFQGRLGLNSLELGGKWALQPQQPRMGSQRHADHCMQSIRGCRANSK